MIKKLSSLLLCATMLLSSTCIYANADDEEKLIYYVKQGSVGDGSETTPFGSIEEALKLIGSRDGTVYIDGEYDISAFTYAGWKGLVTITGNDTSVITSSADVKVSIPGKISFENIDFDLGAGSSFCGTGKSIAFDIGNNTFDGTIYLSSTSFAGYAICSDLTVESGTLEKVVLGNSDTEHDTYASSGTVDIEVNGGVIDTLVLSPESESADKTTISGSVNVVCSNGGNISKIICNNDSSHTIKGAVSLIFNDGVGIPESFAYPKAEQGEFVITSAEGGSILATNDIGVFKIKPDFGNALSLKGKTLEIKDNLRLSPSKYDFGWTESGYSSDDSDIKIIGEPVVIYYDPNGGINPPAAKDGFTGISITISSKMPENEGYRFLGWSHDKDAVKAEIHPGDKYLCKENVSLYAVWEKIEEYTLAFSADGSYNIPDAITVTAGEKITIPKKTPLKPNSTFIGWSVSSKSQNVAYLPDDEIEIVSDATLYAVWKEKTEIILKIDSIEATVSGVKVENDVPPIIENDRTMLPARFVAENLGANVEWDDTSRAVIITAEDTEIIIAVGSDKAYVNGEKITLDSPAFIRNDRTYTPVRFICENLGAEVEWNETERTVTITK